MRCRIKRFYQKMECFRRGERDVARLALREKQIQQSYRPIIGVHKWFARRPGRLFRSLALSEFGRGALHDSYFF